MFGVVMAREATSMFRNRWVLAVFLLPLVLFSLLVIARWPSEAEVDLAGDRAIQVFRLFAYAVLATLLLIAPAYPASSLVTERRRGTLALLLQTPLSRQSIYFGKLGASLCYTWIPLVMSLPVAAACYSLGAIDAVGQLAVLYAVLGIVAVEVAVVALWVGSRTSSAISAMRLSYAIVMGIAFVALLPYWFAIRGGGESSAATLWLRSVSPLPAVMEITGQGDLFGGGIAVETGAAWRYCVTGALFSVVFAALTIRHIRPTMLERTRTAGLITDDRSRRVRQLRRVLFLIDPQRRSRGIADWMNPVLIKEFRTRRLGRGSWMVRMIAASAVISLAVTYASATGAVGWSTETIGGVMVVMQVTLIVVVAPSIASGLISDEFETHGWSLIRMTPLTTSQIVTGKLLSVAWTVLLLLLATLPGYAVIMVIKPIMMRQVLAVVGTLLLTGGFAILLSATLSSALRRTAQATIAAYATLIAIFGGTLAVWLGRGSPFGPQIVEAALTVNPIAAALSLIEAPGFESYHLVPACWYFVGAATLLCLVALCIRTQHLTRPE